MATAPTIGSAFCRSSSRFGWSIVASSNARGLPPTLVIAGAQEIEEDVLARSRGRSSPREPEVVFTVRGSYPLR
jgi:hypothetical protein